MKKFLYLFLALILTLFIGIKVNSYFKSIETKINLLDRSYMEDIFLYYILELVDF